MNARPCLEIRGLRKEFGGVKAVDGIDLDLYAGEILGLIGPNGSGKSTVMSLIMGVEKPDAGTVMLRGIDIAGLPPYRIAQAGVGIMFQHSRPLWRQTVLENVKLALLPDSLFRLATSPEIDVKARAIAELVGLGQVVDRRPGGLSFADLRRMELAKTIARDPAVVLIDEPFAGLTVAEADSFAELIRSLGKQGRAILLVDHSVRSIAALADRVVAMYVGSIIAEGNADEVMADEMVRRVYLGGDISVVRPSRVRSEGARPLLQVEQAQVSYGKATALDKVDLRVNERECVSIVGLNGAGKTTLFNAISGLLRHEGKIHFDGKDLDSLKAGEIARFGLVQCPESRELFGTMTVRENLDIGGHLLAPNARKSQLDSVFGLFPILASRQTQAARTLSGGQQQMLAIGRALMMRPKLLILDEPTLGLAPVVIEQLSDALDKLRRTTPLTLVLGEQNVKFALPHADRVYVLDRGRITWQGSAVNFAKEKGVGYL
ncbi:MAG TPA: ATP-binding cassette domain-containing protein [Bradyrhizobium sp.]|nr:ATP-binding cassette domain-containing protein [Bradyrhizobium sp.]